MPWKSLAPYRDLRDVPAMNRVSVQIRDLQIRLDPRLLTELGWAVGDRIDVLAGGGDHAGFARLEPNNSGWRLHPPGGKSGVSGGALKIRKSLAAKDFAGMPERLKPQTVEVKIVDGGIEFALPWAAKAAKASKAEKPTSAHNNKEKPAEPTAASVETALPVLKAPEESAPAANEKTPPGISTPAVPAKAPAAKAQPKIETVEEALARGVTVTIAPPAMPGTSGLPVREKAHPYSGGRVRG